MRFVLVFLAVFFLFQYFAAAGAQTAACHYFDELTTPTNRNGEIKVIITAVAMAGKKQDPAPWNVKWDYYLKREVFLLHQSLGEKIYAKFNIRYYDKRILCKKVTVNSVSKLDCNYVPALKACGERLNDQKTFVFAFVKPGNPLIGTFDSSTWGRAFSDVGFAYGVADDLNYIGVLRHELGHMIFCLSDRYAYNAGYHIPTVYPSLAVCQAFISEHFASFKRTYSAYLGNFLSTEDFPWLMRDQTSFKYTLSQDQINRLLKTPVCTSFVSSASETKGQTIFVVVQPSIYQIDNVRFMASGLFWPELSFDEYWNVLDLVQKNKEKKKNYGYCRNVVGN